jgi:hypothetical protein
MKSTAGTYTEPRKEELAVAEKVFAGLFSAKRNLKEISDLAREIRFELTSFNEGGEELLALREMESDRRGRGMYVFRTENPIPLAIEAPHSDDDLHTGLLAELCFLETRAAATAWNTVRRDQPFDAGTKAEADLAHLPDSVFVAFTRAFAAAYPKGVLLQLHGFSKTERKSAAGSQADAILSGGTESPAAWIVDAAACLKERCGGVFSVYPRDVKELGATTNSEMKALRKVGHAGFLHVEMCLELRRRLKSSVELRKAFWRCLPEKQP